MRNRILGVLTTILLTVVVLACGRQGNSAADASKVDPEQLKAFAPLPEVVAAANAPASQELTDLGRMLYFEKRLSKSQQLSCNSCHDLATFGVDLQPTSPGHKGQHGDRNSPTVYNAAAHFAQFWDGRAPDVEAQAKGPMMNPVEMAMPSEHVVISVLASMPEYVKHSKRRSRDRNSRSRSTTSPPRSVRSSGD